MVLRFLYTRHDYTLMQCIDWLVVLVFGTEMLSFWNMCNTNEKKETYILFSINIFAIYFYFLWQTANGKQWQMGKTEEKKNVSW